MSRPIVLTEEIKKQLQAEFSEVLDKTKMTDGKISYSKGFKYENSNAVVWLTMEAYNKILALVTEFSEEVGWHGTVTRKFSNEFVIEDIFVYPQEVTGSTVNTDQKEYTDWLNSFDNEIFSKLKMQGHSHVNMGVSPSGVDERHREQILGQLEKDMFYIFMVWNKKLDIHTLIYDMDKNILYEDKDIEVKLTGNNGLNDFMADAKEKVQKFSAKKNKAETNKRENAKAPKNLQDYKRENFDPDLAEFGYYPFSHYGDFRDAYDLGGREWT